MENENELQNDEILTTSGTTVDIETMQTLNQNICMSSLYITGAIGILCGILLGGAFHGIFRNK